MEQGKLGAELEEGKAKQKVETLQKEWTNGEHKKLLKNKRTDRAYEEQVTRNNIMTERKMREAARIVKKCEGKVRHDMRKRETVNEEMKQETEGKGEEVNGSKKTR